MDACCAAASNHPCMCRVINEAAQAFKSVLVGEAQVKKVEEDGVWLQCKDQSDLQKLTAGTTLWATGIKMNPLSTAIAGAMPDGQQVGQSRISPLDAVQTTLLHTLGQCWARSLQEHRHAIHVDQHLVVNGSGGSIFALGDAATVDQPHVLDHAEDLFRQADVNGDGVLSTSEVSCCQSLHAHRD